MVRLFLSRHQLSFFFEPSQTTQHLIMKFLVAVLIFGVANGLVAPRPAASSIRRSTQLAESFGFEYAEDTYENQPDFLKGGESGLKCIFHCGCILIIYIL
jgi:hypothetical protein